MPTRQILAIDSTSPTEIIPPHAALYYRPEGILAKLESSCDCKYLVRTASEPVSEMSGAGTRQIPVIDSTSPTEIIPPHTSIVLWTRSKTLKAGRW
jgi:hypothetical protein